MEYFLFSISRFTKIFEDLMVILITFLKFLVAEKKISKYWYEFLFPHIPLDLFCKRKKNKLKEKLLIRQFLALSKLIFEVSNYCSFFVCGTSRKQKKVHKEKIIPYKNFLLSSFVYLYF